MKFLIKKAEIVESEGVFSADILIENGFIKRIDRGINSSAAEVIDADGCVVFPAFIDLHAHLREPGEEYKENIESGLKAALSGGYCAVVSMPNTKPVVDNSYLVKYLLSRAEEAGAADLYVCGAITRGLSGEVRTDFEELAKSGAVAFSDDGKYVQNSGIILEALKEARMLGRPLMLHEEDYGLSRNSYINYGEVSFKTGLYGNHFLSEVVPVFRDIVLAKETGARIHIQHISSAATVEILRRYKDLLVTSEVTPHHLLFSENHCLSLDSNYKVNPPLRSENDRQELIQALIEGVIDCIATDHAPHSAEEKALPFRNAPPGIAWFELTFPALYTKIIRNGILDYSVLFRALVKKPAEILGVETPSIKEGKIARLSVFDVSTAKTLEKRGRFSAAANNPLAKESLYGFARFVINGKKYYDGRENPGRILVDREQ